MPLAREDTTVIRVSRTVAERLKAAPMTMKLRGHDARIRAADTLLTEGMNSKGVPIFETEEPSKTVATLATT